MTDFNNEDKVSVSLEELEKKKKELEDTERALEARKASLDALENYANEKVRRAEEILQKSIDIPDIEEVLNQAEYRRRFDLSWLRHEDVVTEIVPYVNVVDGRKFAAVTMPDGKTYVQAKLLDQIIRRLALRFNVKEIAELDDRSSMRRVMIATTNFLKRHKVISEDDLPGNYFGRPYILTWRGGREVEVFYVPMNTEVFGCSDELEARKPAKLQDIENIEPKEQI